MRKLIGLFALSLLTGWLSAQSTTVSTSGVIDHDSSTWIGGTYTIQFKPNPSFPAIGQYVWTGGNLQNNLQFAGVLDGSGAFSVSIPDNSTITPAGSSWNFIICPNATSGCFNTALPVNGATFSVTTQLNALANGPRFPAGGSAHGYADVEITPTPLPGGTYYNVTTNFIRVWNGTSWSNIGGGGGSGNVLASPQFQIGYFPSPGTVATVQGAGATTDAQGNVQTLSTNGYQDAFKHQTNPTSNDGIHNSLQTPGNSVLVGPDYANVEAPVADFSVDWRYPLDFFDAAAFFNIGPGYAIDTIFEDQRFNGAGKSNKGTYIYNPFSYQSGVAIPAIYNRTTYDRLPLLVGQGVASVAQQDDVLIYGSGKNQSGLPDSRAGWDWTFFNQDRGISSPINWNVFCGGWGDCHTVQNTLIYSGSCAVGSDECNALYRNQALEDFKVWTATSPSNQATGTTQILGTYLDSSGLQGDASPLMDSTQASSQFLITSVTGPGFNNAGTLTFTGIAMTPDTIGRVIHNYTQAEIPQQYNGGTTSVTITATSLTAPLTVGRGCWADSNFNEQMAITAVGTFSGGTQTATVNARYEHLTNSTSGSASYVTQGPQACKYFEALANRVASGTAPLRNWVRIIGCPTSGSCLYAVSGAGNWQKWPGGAFTDFNFPTGTTLTRDGSGHTSLTVSGVIPSLHNSFIRIHASDVSYNGDFQIAATVVSGNTIFTWANAGGAGTTTTTAPTYLLANALNLGGLTEANAAIMIPGCEIVYTGNSTTHLQDGNTLCEANNLTVASGDQLEAQHGNEPSADIEHSLVVAWTPTSSSLGSNGHFQQISGNLIDFYTWNILNVALNNGGESQLLGQGGTRIPTARFQVIEGDRIWDAFFITPAPLTDLWKVTSCPIVNLTGSTSCSIPAQPWNILDIANPHTSFQMSWQEHNQTFLINNNARDSFIDDPVNGFQMNGNDGVSSNFGNKFNSSGITTFLGDGSGNATTFNTAIGLVSTSVNVGANTSHFNQTSTSFAMDAPLSVQGSPVCTVASPCSAITLTTTGTSGAATLTGTVLNIPIYAGGGGGGTVTNFSSGNLSPLFTTSVATSTSTPAQTFTASNTAQNAFLAGPFSGGTGPYSFRSILVVDLPTGIPNANLAAQTANTVLGALTATTPSGLAMPSCSGATNALKWTSGTGFGCNTITPGAGTVTTSGSPTTGFFPLFTGAAVIGNSHLDDGITSAATITSTEPIAINATGVPSQLDLAPSGTSPATVTGSASVGVPNTVTTPGVYLLPAAPCSGYATYTNASGIVTTTCTTIPSSVTATATPGSGVTSVTCITAACTNLRGTFTVVGGTATTGTIATLAWTATPTAYACSVSQNDTGVSTVFVGLGHSVATTTGMTITAGISIISTTFSFDYSCTP